MARRRAADGAGTTHRRRRRQLAADGDPSVPAGRQSDDRRRPDREAGQTRHRAGRPLARRARAGQRRQQHDDGRHERFGSRRRSLRLQDPGAGDDQGRLQRAPGRRADRRVCGDRTDHPAEHPVHHLRLDGRSLHRSIVPGRRHPRHPDGAVPDGSDPLHRPLARLPARLAALTAPDWRGTAQLGSAADVASDHPGRHPERGVHADRGRRRRGRVRAALDAGVLPHAATGGPAEAPAGDGHLHRYRDVGNRRLRSDSLAAGACAGRRGTGADACRDRRQPVAVLVAAQRCTAGAGHVCRRHRADDHHGAGAGTGIRGARARSGAHGRGGGGEPDDRSCHPPRSGC